MQGKTVWLATLLLAMLAGAPGRLGAQAQPRRGSPPPAPAAPAAKLTPLTAAEVIEGLYSLGSVNKVEELIVKRGVGFQATPQIVELLKEFGATDRILRLIPPAAAAPAAPKYAGALTVTCVPADCMVVVNDKFYGMTRQGRTVISDLVPGDAVVQIFSEGYETQTLKIQPDEGKELDARVVLKTRPAIRQQMAKESLLDSLRAIGGVDGFSYLGEFGGDGKLDWADPRGGIQQWAVTFTKRPGNDISMIFKSPSGQCSVSILNGSSRKECKGKAKGSAEDIVEQAAAVFVKYQVATVLQQLLDRSAGLSTADDGKRLQSVGDTDSYLLTLESNLPTGLVYTARENPPVPIAVKYSNYEDVGKGRYPAKMEIGPENAAPTWVFTLSGIQTRAVRR